MRLRAVYPIIVCLLVLPTIAAAQVSARSSATNLRASQVVTTYFGILNAGMKSGDFSALATVYAPDATLTRSTPKGVTTVIHGLPAITGFYQTLPTLAPGYQWTTTSMRSLAPDIVLAYERAGTPSMAVASRCAHVIVVHGGKIVSYDWIAFFPGKK